MRIERVEKLAPTLRALIDDTMSTLQAADYVGHHPQTLTQWRSDNDGKGPAYIKIGSKVRYRKAALDEWLAKRFQEGPMNKIMESA
jgi:excisionase family DNA binding protein